MSAETPIIKAERIKHEEIAYLEGPILSLLREMLPNIERGEYDLIIGIGASGPLPTLIIEKFIKHVYSKKGLVMPDTRFLAGNIIEENAEKEIEKWNPLKKVLIIEDTIASGASIRALCSILDYDGIRFDVATVANLYDRGGVDRRIADHLGAENIFFGTSMIPEIYGQHDLSGVEKEGEGESFSKSYKQSEKDRGYDTNGVQERLNEAREDAGIVSQHLIDWYESQKQ